MSRILLKNMVTGSGTTDVMIKGNIFSYIGTNCQENADQVIDGQGRMAILPPFYNMHTHAAMSLLRGYADDMELFKWLSEFIWPVEAKLTAEDVYIGTRLAIIEMIKSGTVFFNDMYWRQKATVQAVLDTGIRACVGIQRLTMNDPVLMAKLDNDYLLNERNHFSSRIQVSFAPHAIYTVSTDDFLLIVKRAAETGLPIHMHLSETQKEFDDCIKEHGMTPTQYVDSLGVLTDKTILAHCVKMTDNDLDIVAKRGSVMVNNPVSNLKLSSGVFRYKAACKAGCRWTIGTDGASSNNCLSMLEEMKTASLLAKGIEGDPELLPADQAYYYASQAGAEAMGIHAGRIETGYLADCLLVKLDTARMTPNYHLMSNAVYSMESENIDTVICDGEILMRGRKVAGEEEVLGKAAECAERFMK